MTVAVRVGPADAGACRAAYRWDADTDILIARLATERRTGQVDAAPAQGMSGSIELTGTEASCVLLEVERGRIAAVEVAVWPEVRMVGTLAPPPDAELASVVVPSRQSQPGLALVEVETALIAEADQPGRTIHFRLGGARAVRTLRIAEDVLIDVDHRDAMTGLWLLNVPPFPAEP